LGYKENLVKVRVYICARARAHVCAWARRKKQRGETTIYM